MKEATLVQAIPPLDPAKGDAMRSLLADVIHRRNRLERPRDAQAINIHDRLIDGLTLRHRIGLAKYGVPVQPHSGRDYLIDMYQEEIDRAVYAVALAEENLCVPRYRMRADAAIYDCLDTLSMIVARESSSSLGVSHSSNSPENLSEPLT